MPLKILHAADASAPADELAKELRRWRDRDVTILLTTAGLESTTGKNDIIREALAAANDGTLLVVRLDETQAPVGTRDAPCVTWSPGAAASEVQAAIRPLAKKTKRGLSGGCLFALVGAGALFAVGFAGLYFMGSNVAMMAPLEEPLGAAPPMSSARYAIEGRWASSLENCPRGYLDIVVTDTGVRFTHADGSVILPITSIDAETGAFTVRDPQGARSIYRADQDVLTMVYAEQSQTLVRCPAPEAEAATEAQVEALQERIDSVHNEVADIGVSTRTIERAFYDLEGRLTLASIVVGVLLVLNLILALRIRLPSRRKTPSAADAVSGSLVVASYARKDGDAVGEVIKQIERGGVAIWMDKADIGAGTTWSEEIVRAIRNSRGLILFCSEHAFESDHVLRELNLADSCRKPVYPVLLEPVQVPDSFLYYLSTRQILDLKNDPDWRTKLAAALTPSVRQVEET